jgi:hypothetical protein
LKSGSLAPVRNKSKSMKSPHLLSLLLPACIGTAKAQSNADLWDVSNGAVVTATSGPIPGYSIDSMFGGFSIVDWAYFSDSQPPGFVHYVEWETPADVTVARIQLYAFGDAQFGFSNNQREFNHFTLRAKSPGSPIYDLTIIDCDATHPYTFEGGFPLLVNREISTVVSHSFRAEFTQYEGGLNFDGPRIVELDAFGPPPPVVTSQPASLTVNYGMPAQFSVQATGTGTLSYQWLKDGVPISGQTSTTLRIAAVTSNDAGAYTVAVKDANGTTTSFPATLVLDYLNAVQSTVDVWDVNAGATITAHTPLYPQIGSIEGMFGGNPHPFEGFQTYFADNMPTGTVHAVEWTTANPVVVNAVRLFAFGDPFLNNSREFDKVTLKAKSAGSSTFNITIGTFTPTHPYTFQDNALILDTRVTPVSASAFRAEFLQYTAGFGFDGPRIVELDAFEGRPLLRPTIVAGPDARTVPKNSTITWKAVARGGDLKYQWKFMGQNISGAITDTLKLKHVKATDQGYYTVVVSNDAGAAESAQALLLVTP